MGRLTGQRTSRIRRESHRLFRLVRLDPRDCTALRAKQPRRTQPHAGHVRAYSPTPGYPRMRGRC